MAKDIKMVMVMAMEEIVIMVNQYFKKIRATNGRLE